jgi:hypothetical protein
MTHEFRIGGCSEAAKVGSAAATRGQLGPPGHTPEPLKPKHFPRGAAERHAAVLLRPGKASGGSTAARPRLECPRPGYAGRETSVFFFLSTGRGGGGGWPALPVGQGRPGRANFRDRLRRHREARCPRAQKGGWARTVALWARDALCSNTAPCFFSSAGRERRRQSCARGGLGPS